jgi:hypothetical protein
VIESVEDFVRLRTSPDPADYRRAAGEPASMQVWLDVIARYPDMKTWVAHNKTIPMEILRLLADDEDPSIRRDVLRKNRVHIHPTVSELIPTMLGELKPLT